MEKVTIAPQASLRADEGSPFYIGKGSNLQDGVTLHGLLDKRIDVGGEMFSIHIGSHCSLAHGALVHGPCSIGKKTFIGFNAIVHNARVGRNCFIHHRALVEGVVLPDYTYVPRGAIVADQYEANRLPRIPRSPAEPRDPLVPEAAIFFNEEVVDYNKKLCAIYGARRRSIDDFKHK
jgi:carbonic anhydrase/acetyltransferase-like protein (isoleucine patch superfamily)